MRVVNPVIALAAAALFSAAATETPYYRNVSDIEVESSIKGCTSDRGPQRGNIFGFGSSSKSSDCCCECTAPATTTTTTKTTATAPSTSTSTTTTTQSTSANTPRIKYILDGKPVYEDGKKGESGCSGAEGVAGVKPKATEISKVEPPKEPAAPPAPPISEDEIKTAISRLSTASWREAQTTLVSAGKAAVPHLIDALNNNTEAFIVGGHTKADVARAPRTRTVGEVCAELLIDIIYNHSNYAGDLPVLNQAAWRDWWNKNASTVTFAGV